MPWVPYSSPFPTTKRERKLAQAKAQERARERAAAREAQRQREMQRTRDSWDRMKADIARKYAA